MRTLFTALVLVFLAFPAIAVEPDEMLDDPVLEARAREISKNLRCLVCQNQSIDDSNAELAGDLRVLVRERLMAGDSDAEVIDFVVSRYGDFVLLMPPFKGTTYVLWIGPVAVAVAAILAFVVFFRRRRGAVEAPPLSAEEKIRLEALMKEDAQ